MSLEVYYCIDKQTQPLDNIITKSLLTKKEKAKLYRIRNPAKRKNFRDSVLRKLGYEQSERWSNPRFQSDISKSEYETLFNQAIACTEQIWDTSFKRRPKLHLLPKDEFSKELRDYESILSAIYLIESTRSSSNLFMNMDQDLYLQNQNSYFNPETETTHYANWDIPFLEQQIRFTLAKELFRQERDEIGIDYINFMQKSPTLAKHVSITNQVIGLASLDHPNFKNEKWHNAHLRQLVTNIYTVTDNASYAKAKVFQAVQSLLNQNMSPKDIACADLYTASLNRLCAILDTNHKLHDKKRDTIESNGFELLKSFNSIADWKKYAKREESITKLLN
jgi:hypothetical protein